MVSASERNTRESRPLRRQVGEIQSPWSGFQQLGFRIAKVGGIPDSKGWILDSKARDSGFHKKKFLGFRNPDYLTRGDLSLFSARPSRCQIPGARCKPRAHSSARAKDHCDALAVHSDVSVFSLAWHFPCEVSTEKRDFIDWSYST